MHTSDFDENWNIEDGDFIEEISNIFSIKRGIERIKSNFFLFLFLISKK